MFILDKCNLSAKPVVISWRAGQQNGEKCIEVRVVVPAGFIKEEYVKVGYQKAEATKSEVVSNHDPKSTWLLIGWWMVFNYNESIWLIHITKPHYSVD